MPLDRLLILTVALRESIETGNWPQAQALLTAREQAIDALASSGNLPDAHSARQLDRLEAQIKSSLQTRQAKLAREFRNLKRARAARKAYGGSVLG